MLTKDEVTYLNKIPISKKASVKPFDPKAKTVGKSVVAKIKKALPKSKVLFMGATALGIAGQNDIDIYVLSKPKDFDRYLPILKKIFGEPKHIHKTFIVWKFDKNGYQVELYLTEPPERQIKVFEILKSNKRLLKEYERLKLDFEGKSFRDYQKAKYEFYNRILEKIDWGKVMKQFEKEMFGKLKDLPGHREVSESLRDYRSIISHELPETSPKGLYRKLINLLLKNKAINGNKAREKYLKPELEREHQTISSKKEEFGKLKQDAWVWVKKNLPEKKLQKMWKAHETWLPRRYTIYKDPNLPFQKIAADILARYYLIKKSKNKPSSKSSGSSMKLLDKFKELVGKIDKKFFYVVMGGIAVDGYVGKNTRDHPDVDMIIFREDLEESEKVLDALGYQHKRFSHPKESDLEYKMQTGEEDHLFSFQIADMIDQDKFEISFYKDPHMIFTLSYIKPPNWLKLEGVKFPAVSKEMLIGLKENEIEFYEKLKKLDLEKYEKKRKQQHLNSLHDLKTLKKMNSSFALICHQNKILLFHRDDIPTVPHPDHWQLPGGGIKKGETPLVALKRELMEEVSFVPKKINFLGKLKTKNGLAHLYLSFVDNNEAKRFKHGKGEGQEIGFFTLDEMENMKLVPKLSKRLLENKEDVEKALKTKSFKGFRLRI